MSADDAKCTPETFFPRQPDLVRYRKPIKIAALDNTSRKDTPYGPNISETCIICNDLYWEYAVSSHGKPVNRKDLMYSSETHRAGIIKKSFKGFSVIRVNKPEKKAI